MARLIFSKHDAGGTNLSTLYHTFFFHLVVGAYSLLSDQQHHFSAQQANNVQKAACQGSSRSDCV